MAYYDPTGPVVFALFAIPPRKQRMHRTSVRLRLIFLILRFLTLKLHMKTVLITLILIGLVELRPSKSKLTLLLLEEIRSYGVSAPVGDYTVKGCSVIGIP